MMEHLFNFYEFSYIQKEMNQNILNVEPKDLMSCPEEEARLNSFSVSKISNRDRPTDLLMESFKKKNSSFLKRNKKGRFYLFYIL